MDDARSDQRGAGPPIVQSLERGLAVIRAFSAESQELTLSEVAQRAGLTRAAARRFLHTLIQVGYVRSDGRHFRLRPRVLELGYAYLSSLSLPQVASPHMEALVERVGETCSLAVLDGGDVVYVARVPTRRRIVSIEITVGSRFPAYATSMGHVLLAAQTDGWLDEYLQNTTLQPFTGHTLAEPDGLRAQITRVRQQDCALADQELEEGIRSVAVPVRDAAGSVAAAMNLSAHTSRGQAETLRRELLPSLFDTAGRVEEDLSASRAARAGTHPR